MKTIMPKPGKSKQPKKSKQNERGAVLLATMLLMTIMAAMAIAIIDDIRFNIKQSIAIQTNAQMSWFLQGAEDFAAAWLKENANNNEFINNAIISNAAQVFEIESGRISLWLEDGNNCFNLNALTINENADRQAEDKSSRIMSRLSALIQFVDIDEADADGLAAKIKDWTDSDNIPEINGAEDFTYNNKTPPYHPANTMMQDISELREIDGMTEQKYQKLLPYLCAMSDNKQNKFNINSMQADDWPLLAMVFGQGSQAVLAAQSVIAKRPQSGYDNIDEVLKNPEVAALDMKENRTAMLGFTTDRLVVHLNVEIEEMSKTRTILFQINQGEARLLARRGAF